MTFSMKNRRRFHPEDGGGKFAPNISIYQTIQRQIPEDTSLYKGLKFYAMCIM
jgi:hypothetical protein